MHTKLLFLILFISLSGCVSAPKDAIRVNSLDQIPTIQQVERERLQRIEPGMKWTEVKQIFPELYPVALDDRTQAFELARVVHYVTDFDASWSTRLFTGGVSGSAHRQILWFYMVDGVLIKWGSPRDWPTKREIQQFF